MTKIIRQEILTKWIIVRHVSMLLSAVILFICFLPSTVMAGSWTDVLDYKKSYQKPQEDCVLYVKPIYKDTTNSAVEKWEIYERCNQGNTISRTDIFYFFVDTQCYLYPGGETSPTNWSSTCEKKNNDNSVVRSSSYVSVGTELCLHRIKGWDYTYCNGKVVRNANTGGITWDYFFAVKGTATSEYINSQWGNRPVCWVQDYDYSSNCTKGTLKLTVDNTGSSCPSNAMPLLNPDGTQTNPPQYFIVKDVTVGSTVVKNSVGYRSSSDCSFVPNNTEFLTSVTDSAGTKMCYYKSVVGDPAKGGFDNVDVYKPTLSCTVNACADNDGDGVHGYDADKCQSGTDFCDSVAGAFAPSVWYLDKDSDKFAFDSDKDGNADAKTQCAQPLNYKGAGEILYDGSTPPKPILDCDDNNKDLNPANGCGKILKYISGDTQTAEICKELPEFLIGKVTFGGIDNGFAGEKDMEWSITKTPNSSVVYPSLYPKNPYGDEETQEKPLGEVMAKFVLGNYKGKYEVTLTCPGCVNDSTHKNTVVYKSEATCPYIPPYKQGGTSSWADEPYDTLCYGTNKEGNTITKTCTQKQIDKNVDRVKISKKGCAMTALSMVWSALMQRIDINPSTANKFLTDINGYDDGLIRWDAIDKVTAGIWVHRLNYSGDLNVTTDCTDEEGKVEAAQNEKKDKNGKVTQKGRCVDRSGDDGSISLNKSLLDGILDRCLPVIVEVFNAKTGSQHWVLVVSKQGTDYAIYDPGYLGNTLLSNYGDIYRYVYYVNTQGGCK